MLIAILSDDRGYDVYELDYDGPCPACELIECRALSVVRPMHLITEERNYLIQPTGPIGSGNWVCVSQPNSPDMRAHWDSILDALRKAAN